MRVAVSGRSSQRRTRSWLVGDVIAPFLNAHRYSVSDGAEYQVRSEEVVVVDFDGVITSWYSRIVAPEALVESRHREVAHFGLPSTQQGHCIA